MRPTLIQVNPGAGRDLPVTGIARIGNVHSATPNASEISALREYWRIIVNHRWIIWACTLIIGAIATIIAFRTTPLYVSSGRIVIEGRQSTDLNSGVQSRIDVRAVDDEDLGTQVRILQSDQVAMRALRQLKGKTGDQLADPLTTDSKKETVEIAGFKSGMTVRILPGTRIIEIDYTSPDPNRAAAAVNAIISAYIDQSMRSHFESTVQASDWLSKELAALQLRMETAEQKLVDYQRANQIIGGEGKDNIVMVKLDALNSELSDAEVDRIKRQAVYESLKEGSLDALPLGGSQGSGSKSLLDTLQSKINDLQTQRSMLSVQFGPSYPKLREIDKQLTTVQHQYLNEEKRVRAIVRNDYLEALRREEILRKAFEAQKERASLLYESSIQYSILKRNADASRQLYDSLLQQLKEAEVLSGLNTTDIRVVDSGRVPLSPSKPNRTADIALGFLAGLALGIVGAFVLETLDNTVRTPDQVEGLIGLPSLAVIPQADGSGKPYGLAVAVASESGKGTEPALVTGALRSQFAEAFRALRTSILLSGLGAAPKVILISSALPQEGKTTTSINTGIVLAQKGSRVLIIDADLRRPGVHRQLHVHADIGLSSVLSGTATLDSVIVPVPKVPNLFVLPAGAIPPQPAELLASDVMKSILDRVRNEYDHIIIDTPPLLSVTDAVMLSPVADAVMLVIHSGRTSKQAIRRASALLSQVGARVAGVVVNGIDLQSADYSYYYGTKYGYGYYYYGEREPGSSTDESQKESILIE